MMGEVRINGVVAEPTVPVFDSSIIRGDGCFEVIRSYAGRPFAMAEHLDRLALSAAKMSLELPDRSALARWITEAAVAGGDCAVRVLVTRGSVIPDVESEPLVIVFWHRWPKVEGSLRLKTVAAPWHAAGEPWALAGAKILSYAPNMAAQREARSHGFDDAILTTGASTILEGPTFCVAWVFDEVLETPSLDLGILDSITRRRVIGLASSIGLRTAEGRYELDRIRGASEVMVVSTMREVQAVSAIDETSYRKGPIAKALKEAFDQLVLSEVS